MGCCNLNWFESDSNPNEANELECSPNISFADLSIGSKDDFREYGEIINTEELNSHRLRSTSCNSLRYSTQIESAFLMTTPVRGTSIVSSSCHLKSNETCVESTLSFINLPTYV